MQTVDRLLNKDAYKFATVVLWKANDLLDCWIYPGNATLPRKALVPRDTIERCRKARQQAGRVMAAVGTDRLQDVLRRYEPDLIDFDEDFRC